MTLTNATITSGYVANTTTVTVTANAATIVLNSQTISGKSIGKIIFRCYNVDTPTSILDVGNSGSNKIEVYPVISGTVGSALDFESELLSDNTCRFTSEDINLTSAISVGIKFQSFARTVAPNFRILEAYILWK